MLPGEHESDSLHAQFGLLWNALRAARERTDAFFSRLVPTAFSLRTIAERHRLIFYLGHLDAFDFNLLGRRVFSTASADPSLDRLFAFGIDPVDGQLPADQPSDWPEIDQVHHYTRQVRDILDAQVVKHSGSGATVTRSECDALAMCLEHRLMHLETLSYKLPYLPLDAFVQTSRVRVCEQPGPTAPGYARSGRPHLVRRIAVPEGTTVLGRNRDAQFGWDNEFCEQAVTAASFAMDARNVTHEEFLDFVREGGYQERSLWTDEDWEWKESRDIVLPIRFVADGDTFRYRAAFEEIPLPLDWPVQVSLAEARAYTQFLRAKTPGGSARLPTEAELHRAAYADSSGQETISSARKAYPWDGKTAVPLVHGNFGCARHDPCAVAAFPEGDSALGFADLIGNGWEWTETVFAPLPGFQIDPRYPGYSQNFFDGKHFIIRGAAACTDVCFVRRSFRNWFQAHYPYVFATFRCVHDAEVG